MTPDGLSVALRALSLVALYQAAGTVFFLALMRGALARSAAGIRRLALASALLAAPLVVAHETLEAARMADSFAGLIDPGMLRLAWFSGNGAAHVAQLAGLGAIAAALGGTTTGGGRLRLATVGAVVAALALTLTGHSRTHPAHGLFALLLGVHLLVVAFWFGALWPLLQVLRAEPVALAGRVLARFSLLAGRSVPLILLAGLGMAWLLVQDWSVLRRPYGELLLMKLAGYLLLLALAAWNRWRLTPLLQANSVTAVPALRRIIGAEFVLICAVLTLTANLTALYSPEG